MLADVFHSVRFCLFRVAELVNPDRLRHKVPPGSASTVAHQQNRKHLPGGAVVLRWQSGSTLRPNDPLVRLPDLPGVEKTARRLPVNKSYSRGVSLRTAV